MSPHNIFNILYRADDSKYVPSGFIVTQCASYLLVFFGGACYVLKALDITTALCRVPPLCLCTEVCRMRACSTSNGWGRWKRSLRIRSTLPSLVGRMMMNQWILGFSLKDYIMCYHVTAHLAKERCARWFLTGNCQTFGSMSTFRCLCVSVLVTSRRYMLIYGRPLISDLCLIRCQQRPFAPLL